MNGRENEEERLKAMSDLIEPQVLEECRKTVNLIDVLDVLKELGYISGYKKIANMPITENDDSCNLCGHFLVDCVCKHNELLEKIENITGVKND